MKIKSKLPKLNKKDFNFYNKNGFIIVKNFLNKKTCKKIINYSLRYAEKPDYPIYLNIHRKSKVFYKIISDKKLIKILKFFQNSPVQPLNDQMIFKKRNTKYGMQSWTFHQDNAYVKADYGKYVIVHLFLENCSKSNGGLVFFAGSHAEDLLAFERRKSHREKRNKDGTTTPGFSIFNSEMKLIRNKYKKIDVKANSGSICIMHSNLVHGSYPNRSKIKDRELYAMAFISKNFKIRDYGRVSKKIPINID